MKNTNKSVMAEQQINILHLEDDPIDAELIHEQLGSANLICNITHVATREAYSNALRKADFDIILSDYKIPMFDGITALKMAQQTHPDLPFIFVSGTMGEDAAIETLTHGATDYVLKNKLTRLPAVVSRAFEENRNQKERKRIDTTMLARSRILEEIYTSDLSLEETCKKILDEVESLTYSETSFFHFLDEDKKNISFQILSSNMLKNQQGLDGPENSYNIETDEDWLESITNKETVIVNRKSSLSNDNKSFKNKDLPVRKLFVPITREGQIVAVISAMNKSTDYNGTDVQIISLLGDFSWEIIKRKRAEETLKENEKRYRSVFENSPVPIWEEDFSGIKAIFDRLEKKGVKNIDAYFNNHPEAVRQCAEAVKIIDVNIAALAMHSASSKKELISQYVETFTSRYFDSFKRELVQLWDGITEHSADSSIRTLSGEIRNVTVFATVCPGSEATLSKVFISLIDITKRKQMENNLRINDERFRMAQAIGRVGNWEYEIPTARFWGSDEAKRLYGFAPELQELSTDNIENYIIDRERVHQALVDLIEKEKPYNIEFEIQPQNSAERRMVFSKAMLEKDKQGNPIKVVGVVQDITERKRAEKEVIQERENFYKILTATPVGIMLVDSNTEIIQANDTLGKIVFKNPADIIGKRIGEGIGCTYSIDDSKGCGSSGYCTVCPLVNSFMEVLKYENSICGKEINLNLIIDNKTCNKWVSVNIEPIVINDEKHLIVAMDDITEKKQLEQNRIANLHFLEGLDRINRVLQGKNNLEEMTKKLLQSLLKVFNCDSVWLANPCEIGSTPQIMQMDSMNKDQLLEEPVSLEATIKHTFRTILKNEGPVQFSKEEGQHVLNIPHDTNQNIKSCLTMAIYPKTGKPWAIGMGHYKRPYSWTIEEENLFQEVGIRVKDTLTSILMYNELQTLIHELYHRTKNNMAVIVSLLELQSQYFNDPKWREALTETQNRIHSMALVHQKLHEIKELSRINLKSYITDLGMMLMSSYGRQDDQIAMKFDVKDVFVEIDYAVPCGLILNELITNAFKYAFPNNREGEIKIHLSRKKNGTVTFTVEDNGVGLDSQSALKKQGCIGIEIIHGLAEMQLNGTVKFETKTNRGLKCQILFSDTLFRKRI